MGAQAQPKTHKRSMNITIEHSKSKDAVANSTSASYNTFEANIKPAVIPKPDDYLKQTIKRSRVNPMNNLKRPQRKA